MPRKNKRLDPETLKDQREQRKERRTRDGQKILGEVSWNETRSMEHGLQIREVKIK